MTTTTGDDDKDKPARRPEKIDEQEALEAGLAEQDKQAGGESVAATKKEKIKETLIKKQRQKATRRVRRDLDHEVDNVVQLQTARVIRANRELDKLKRALDAFFEVADAASEEFPDQRRLLAKLHGLKRLMHATRLGLDRQRLRLYDIDQNVIRDELTRTDKDGGTR